MKSRLDCLTNWRSRLLPETPTKDPAVLQPRTAVEVPEAVCALTAISVPGNRCVETSIAVVLDGTRTALRAFR